MNVTDKVGQEWQFILIFEITDKEANQGTVDLKKAINWGVLL